MVNETQEIVDLIIKGWDINRCNPKPTIAKVIDYKHIDAATIDWIMVYFVSYNPQLKGEHAHDYWSHESVQAIDIRTGKSHDKLMELRDEAMRTIYEKRKCTDIDGYDRLDIVAGPGDLSDKMRLLYRWVMHVKMTGYYRQIIT
jgi:hypothetical protein